MSALYPDVPFADGVPNVLRDETNSDPSTDTAMSSDGTGLPTDSAPTWGIFDDGGALAITPDSFNAIETQKEFQISTFPVEEGGFQSYNKVETPYRLRVILTKGGSLDERSAFLSDCEHLQFSTDLFSIVTPEKVYDDANVVRVGQVRNAQQGAQLLTLELIIEEVRQTASSAFTKAQDPSNSDQVNGGQVQTQTPSPAQTPTGTPQ